MSHDNIEKFRFFDACYAIKRTSSQLNYVELYKKSFDLMSTFFNECTTRQKTFIFNLELIFFLNDLKNAIKNVFFDDKNNWIFFKSYWNVEMFLLNNWVIKSFFWVVTRIEILRSFFWIVMILNCFLWTIKLLNYFLQASCFLWTSIELSCFLRVNWILNCFFKNKTKSNEII